MDYIELVDGFSRIQINLGTGIIKKIQIPEHTGEVELFHHLYIHDIDRYEHSSLGKTTAGVLIFPSPESSRLDSARDGLRLCNYPGSFYVKIHRKDGYLGKIPLTIYRL
jgi:hypothetical protein